MVFLYKTVHLSEDPCYTLSKSGLIESPYIQATRTRFVQPGKIEIDANERAVIENFNAAFSFASSSILSLTICRADGVFYRKIMPYRLFRCLHKIMNNYKPAMKQDVVVLRFVGYIKGDDLSCDKTV